MQMTTVAHAPVHAYAQDGADAVRRFNSRLGPTAPDRIQVRLDGRDGMARLCEVEMALAALWPHGTAKELVWLTRRDASDGDRLHLRAFSVDGEVLCAATYCLSAKSPAQG